MKNFRTDYKFKRTNEAGEVVDSERFFEGYFNDAAEAAAKHLEMLKVDEPTAVHIIAETIEVAEAEQGVVNNGVEETEKTEAEKTVTTEEEKQDEADAQEQADAKTEAVDETAKTEEKPAE